MSDKILVTYASRGGSTMGVAEAIGRTLTERGMVVDVRAMQEVHDLSPYQAVVAGSAIHREKWLPEAMQFMTRHQKELSEKPFAAFLVCLALALNRDKQRERAKVTAATWLEPVRTLVKPASEGLFAGVLYLKKLPGPVFGLIARVGILLGIWSEGDHRDWDAIRDWADQLPATLMLETET